jgi:dipeptidyl-peptidase-4
MNGVPFAYVQNRTQTYLDFQTWPDPAGKPVKLFRVTTKAWVEDLGAPVVLADGSFLVQNERTGWKHVYHYAADGTELNAVTRGEWEAREINRVDEKEGYVYVTGTRDGHNRTHLYRVKIDGSGDPERLTPAGFSHSVNVAPVGPYFVSTYSNIETPPVTAIFKIGDDKPVRVLNETTLPKSRGGYTFGKVERVQVPLKDGFALEGILTYPPDFDPTKKYPLWVLTYAGPHTPTVKDAWAGRVMEQVIANAGVVAFNVDPRAASGKGAVSAWAAYKQLGVEELRDLEEAVAWVKAKGWLDDTRVGLQGHSYGGYITAYALTHSKVFSAGISGAPVTDWNLYDTIYTERYMGLPKENPDGYVKSSVVKAAHNLHGKLLLIHGMIDDNVHLQNTAQLMAALQKANKDFEVMFYPGSRHGIAGGTHYQRLMANFLFKSMGVTSPKSE